MSDIVSVIVPVYNEADNIGFLTRLIAEAFQSANVPYELLLVDDSSTDTSLAACMERARLDGRVRIVAQPRHRGQASALRAGFECATGSVLVTLDADLQDDPREAVRLVGCLNELGVDCIIGQRVKRKDTRWKRFASFAFNVLVSLMMRHRVRDVNSGLKVLRRDVAVDIPLCRGFHRFFALLVAARGFRIVECPVHHNPRRFGVSKYTSCQRLGEVTVDLFLIAILTQPTFVVLAVLLLDVVLVVASRIATSWGAYAYIGTAVTMTAASVAAVYYVRQLERGYRPIERAQELRAL